MRLLRGNPRKLIILTLCLAVIAILLTGCNNQPEPPAVIPDPTPETPIAIPDEGPPSGPVTHTILATGTPGVNEYSQDNPGSSELLPREYPGAPPLIPHKISNLTITKDANACLSCHLTGVSLGEGHVATIVPESHYTDAATGIVGEYMQELRYNCLLCHLPQTGDAPLVE